MASAKIKNTTSYARTGVVTLGVPFSRGENLRATDTLVVAGAYSSNNSNQLVQWYPQGATWDNGAVKYARVSFTTDLSSQEEKTVSIQRATSSTPIPFSISPSLLSNLFASLFIFTIEGTTYTIPMSSIQTIEGGQTNDHYSRHRFFTHLPSAINQHIRYIWVEIVVDLLSNRNHVPFYFRFGHYRFFPGMPNASGVSPVMNLTQPVTLRIAGPYTKIRWENQKVQAITTTSATDKTYQLINPGINTHQKLPAGISHCYKGVLCFDTSAESNAELENPILAMAVDWKNLYPITNVMPGRPAYSANEAEDLTRSNTLLNVMQNTNLNTRGPYNWPSTCNQPNTTGTGAHGTRDYAYGMRGWPILLTTNYNWIPFLEFATRQQACRHNWYYGTDGEPVPPNDFHAAGTRFWSGALWYYNEEYLNGYNDYIRDSDCPWINGVGAGPIYGPDKEHYTNTLFIIQGLITMDWFSLEYAKMYSKYWIYANRTDNYGGGYASDIDKWGTARAVGRTYQCAAFLYEFYADPELKYWIERRFDYNYSRFYPLSRETLPGGTNMIRAVGLQPPCEKAACLRNLYHWRPWEEGQSCWGMYLIAKTLLNEDPNSSRGALMLRMARDISATVLMYGYMDCRSTTTRRCFVLGPFSSETALRAFINNNGFGLEQMVTGLTSGASGRLYYYHLDVSRGGFGRSLLVIWLREASGSFVTGEQIRLGTGLVSPVNIFEIYYFAGGTKSVNIDSAGGFGVALTEAEREIVVQDYDQNYPIIDWPPGLFRNNYFDTVYILPQIGCAPIAMEAAAENWYPDSNSTILARAIDYLDFLGTRNNTDNGDFNETFQTFAGYFVGNVATPTSVTVYPSPLRMITEIPEVTVSVTNPSVDVSVSLDQGASIQTTSSPARTITTTSTSVTVRPVGSQVSLSVTPPRINSSRTAQPSASETTVTCPEISRVFTINNLVGGRRQYTYIYMEGPPNEQGTDPTLVNETPQAILIVPANTSLPESSYHRISLLDTIGTPTTDYVLSDPIFPFGALRGETIGLNGQTLRPVGYAWYVGSTSNDPRDETSYQINEAEMVHTITQAAKNGSITSWRTLMNDDGTEIDWLRRVDVNNGFDMNELYRFTTDTPRVYNPTYGGTFATNGSFHSSPVRLARATELTEGYKVEGAVTPLERDSYGGLIRYSTHGGSASNPAIAIDMKQYFCAGIGTDANYPGTTQFEYWSFHSQSIPAADTTSLSNILEINLVDIFNRAEFYNPTIDYGFDVSELFVNRSITFEATTSASTVVGTANGTNTPINLSLPSIFPDGSASIILTSTNYNFSIGLVAKLYSTSNELTRPTKIGLRNEKLPATAAGVDVDSGQVLYIKSEGSSRPSGWIGMRAYLVVGRYADVKSNISSIYSNGLLNKTISENGLFTYERPAII